MSTVQNIIDKIQPRIGTYTDLYWAFNNAIRTISKRLFVLDSDLVRTEFELTFEAEETFKDISSTYTDFWRLMGRPRVIGETETLKPAPTQNDERENKIIPYEPDVHDVNQGDLIYGTSSFVDASQDFSDWVSSNYKVVVTNSDGSVSRGYLGAINTSVSFLDYDNRKTNDDGFSIGDTIIGATSGATATGSHVLDNGDGTGTLGLTGVSGTFQDDEIIYVASYEDELLTDGDCSSDSFNDDEAGWAYDAGNQEYDATAATGTKIYQSGILTSGYFYRTVVTLKNYSSGRGYVNLGGSGNGVVITGDVTAQVDIIQAGGAGFSFYGQTAYPLTASVDDMSCKKITNAALANGTVYSLDDVVINVYQDSDFSTAGWLGADPSAKTPSSYQIQAQDNGTPEFFEMVGTKIYIWPCWDSSGDGMNIVKGYYFAKPTEITDTGDTIPFDELFDEVIEEYLVKIVRSGYTGADEKSHPELLRQFIIKAVDQIVWKVPTGRNVAGWI